MKRHHREHGSAGVNLERSWSIILPSSFFHHLLLQCEGGWGLDRCADLLSLSPPDVAISAPYGGPQHQGLVYIHNGRARGPDPTPSQVSQSVGSSLVCLQP